MNTGADTFSAGANAVANGNASLNKSWGTLTSSVATLNSGLTQISDGNQTVKEGWTTLTDGVQQVDDGIGSGELASGLQGGAEQVGAIQVNDANIAQFASPVALVGDTINEFPLYRYANAPYVLSLGLFVGVLILTLFMDLRRPEEHTGSVIA